MTDAAWTNADREPTAPPLPLFDRPHAKPVAKPFRRSLEDAFLAYHRANPHVLDAFVAVALAERQDGAEKLGAKAIAEMLRWRGRLATSDPGEGFRLPNAHVAFYARLAMHREPRLRGLFDLARQTGLAPFDPATVVP